MGTFGLYIHIPYCRAKCPYCDFNSYAAQRWPEQAYVAALCDELSHYAALAKWRGGRVSTVFFGGGTPSLFSARSIRRILTRVSELWELSPLAETTLEANPGTVSLGKLSALRAAGVNRVSFGIQSFTPRHLRTLGRIHSGEDAVAAVQLARAAGFADVSIDLIFALPQQTLAEWEGDLRQGCALRPDHISAYNLTYEPGTPFHTLRARGALRELPEEIEVAMFLRTRALLAAAGYQQYEISNYARPGFACRHNLNYWRSGDYLGVGAGAHSYTAAPCGRRIGHSEAVWGWRWSNERLPDRYLRAVRENGQGRSTEETLDERQARGEFVFLGLRCREGFAATEFRQRFGAAFPAAFPHVYDLCAQGLLRDADERWRLTTRGFLVADSVFATFL
ncbi:MAG: radical SAM family heme chaperone HemW [Candidatus Binatia bacterium]